LANTVDVRKQIRQLTGTHELLECTSGAEQRGGGVAKRYKVSKANLSLDDKGKIVGLDVAGLGILDPSELESKIKAAQADGEFND